MRTTIAASPRRLHWQAAFTTKTYKPQTSSLVVWQHVFVSDTPMTNWGGSSLLLTWVVKRHLPHKMLSGRQTRSTTNHRGATADRAIELLALSHRESLPAAEVGDSMNSPTVQLRSSPQGTSVS